MSSSAPIFELSDLLSELRASDAQAELRWAHEVLEQGKTLGKIVFEMN